MLQSFRDNLKGTLAVIVIGLMIIPFALFGVDSLFLQDGSAGKAAEVNGQVISEVDLSRAIRNQKQQLLDRYGEQAPVELLSDENLRQPVLNRLVQREIIQDSAVQGGMTIADTQLDQLIVLSPQFQQGGKFNPELYTQLLRSSGFTPTTYKNLLTQDIVVRQHISGVADTAFMTERDIGELVALSQQTRTFSYVTLSQDSAAEGVDVAEEELQAYYDGNNSQFMSKEQIAIEYIELSLEELARNVDVSEKVIAEQYAENLKSFSGNVLRQAAHILIEEQDPEKRQAIVDEVQLALNSGAEFSELVQKFSDDLGSKEAGGDLGVTDGSTFPDSFEAALASLAVDEVSGPINTDAGTHFIKLLSEQKEEAPSLDESRDLIREEVALAEAEAEFLELLEALPDATYNATDLMSAAQELGLNAQRSELFGRDGGQGVAGNNQVLALAFTDEVLSEGQVTDLLELGDDHVVVFRVAEHKPSSVKPFSDVREQIRENLTDVLVQEKLSLQASVLESELLLGKNVEELATSNSLEWQAAIDVNRANNTYPKELIGYVFNQPKPVDEPVVGSVALSDGSYAVIKLESYKSGELPELPPEQKAGMLATVSQQQGTAELSLFETEKRDLAEIVTY